MNKIQFSKESSKLLKEKYGCNVFRLNAFSYKLINKLIKPKQTEVPKNMKVKEHLHSYKSYYLVSNNALKFEDNIFELPEYALVLIKPNKKHPWINTNKTKVYVGDLSPNHGQQIVVPS